jgi:hypothetical protein
MNLPTGVLRHSLQIGRRASFYRGIAAARSTARIAANGAHRFVVRIMHGKSWRGCLYAV